MVCWKEIKKLSSSHDDALTFSPTQKSPTKFSIAFEQFLASPPLHVDDHLKGELLKPYQRWMQDSKFFFNQLIIFQYPWNCAFINPPEVPEYLLKHGI